MQLELEMFQSKLITEQSTLEALVAGGVAPGGVASGDGEENRELAKQLAVVNYLQVPLPQCVCVCHHSHTVECCTVCGGHQ